MVGEGGFGRVYQVRHILTSRIYAMKTLRKKFLVNTNNVSYTFVERNVLRKVRHPFVCGLHFAFQTKGKVYLIMDFLNGGQIFYHLKRQTMFDETEVQFYAAEISLALSHLHSLGILHRFVQEKKKRTCFTMFFSETWSRKIFCWMARATCIWRISVLRATWPSLLPAKLTRIAALWSTWLLKWCLATTMAKWGSNSFDCSGLFKFSFRKWIGGRSAFCCLTCWRERLRGRTRTKRRCATWLQQRN